MIYCRNNEVFKIWENQNQPTRLSGKGISSSFWKETSCQQKCDIFPEVTQTACVSHTFDIQIQMLWWAVILTDEIETLNFVLASQQCFPQLQKNIGSAGNQLTSCHLHWLYRIQTQCPFFFGHISSFTPLFFRAKRKKICFIYSFFHQQALIVHLLYVGKIKELFDLFIYI